MVYRLLKAGDIVLGNGMIAVGVERGRRFRAPGVVCRRVGEAVRPESIRLRCHVANTALDSRRARLPGPG